DRLLRGRRDHPARRGVRAAARRRQGHQAAVQDEHGARGAAAVRQLRSPPRRCTAVRHRRRAGVDLLHHQRRFRYVRDGHDRPQGRSEPPRITRIFWACASGLIAASLIWVSSLSDGDSGMEGLQALALLSALPFSVVMIGMTISLWRSLGDEVKVIEKLELRLRQGEFIQRYPAELTDEVSGRAEDRVEEQVEAQVSEHLSTYTAEMPAVPVEESQPWRGSRRRGPRNPFSLSASGISARPRAAAPCPPRGRAGSRRSARRHRRGGRRPRAG